MKITYPKLPKKFKSDWLKSLRSGKYKQAQSTLYNQADKTFCCLGVACDMVGHKRTLLKHNDSLIEGKRYSNIPRMLKDISYRNKTTDKLTAMNDGAVGRKSQSFKQIANWIERNL